MGTYDEDMNDKFSNELRELYDIHEYIRENMNVDAVDNSIEATKLNLNIMPNQRENLNTEGSYFVDLLCAMVDRDVDDIKKAKENLKENVIEDLFKSQGYELIDICDDEKINESEFLSTFYAELSCLRIDAGCFLVFLTKLNLKDYYRLINNEISINFERGTCGLFDPVFGGGSILEVSVDSETGDKYLVIHTGSRNLGKQIAEYWHKVGIEKSQAGIKDLATIKGEDLENYLKDTFVAQKYASLNRETIARVILDKAFDLNLDDLDHFETIHNYIDPVDKILRKGAISAKKDEIVLIPLNMRDGSLICKGKGNPDWNESAPHGAGRILSRGQAKECVDLEEFVDSMKGIYSSSIGTNTLDEAPMVYKNSEDIKKCIVDTVEVIKHIKPIYNIKA